MNIINAQRVLELAKKAGAIKRYWGEGKESFAFQSDEQLEAFAALVRAEQEWVDLEPNDLCEIEERLGFRIDSWAIEMIGNAYIAAFKEKNK